MTTDASNKDGVPVEYRLEHITDVALIPEEHMDEAMETLRMMFAQLSILRHAMLATGDTVDLRQACPVVRFTPNGEMRSTARFPSGHEFVMEKEP